MRSLITRAVLMTIACLAVLGALAFLAASGHTALANEVGTLYANLILAGVLLVVAGILVLVARRVKKRAELRRQAALGSATAMLVTLRGAASAVAGNHALAIIAAALVAGFLFGNSSGDSGEQDE